MAASPRAYRECGHGRKVAYVPGSAQIERVVGRKIDFSYLTEQIFALLFGKFFKICKKLLLTVFRKKGGCLVVCHYFIPHLNTFYCINYIVL